MTWRSLMLLSSFVAAALSVALVLVGLFYAPSALAQFPGGDAVIPGVAGGLGGSALGGVIGSWIGSWRAVRKAWDEEATSRMRNVMAEEFYRHQLTCPLARAAGIPPPPPPPRTTP